MPAWTTIGRSRSGRPLTTFAGGSALSMLSLNESGPSASWSSRSGLEAGGDMLYAHFGELLTPIGGDFASPTSWNCSDRSTVVAFQRRADPPPRVLDRDHEFIAQLRAQLPAAQTPGSRRPSRCGVLAGEFAAATD